MTEDAPRLPNAVLAARNLTLKQARRAGNRARYTWKVAHEGVKDAMHAVGYAREAVSNRAVNAGKHVLRAVRRPARQLQRRRVELKEQWGWNRIEWQVERDIGEVVAGNHPVIAGPWLAEVGYEVLYWIPFLRWVTLAYQLDPARVLVISRGGVSGWYEGIGGRYAEMWDHITPEEFARRNADRGALKQLSASDLERDLVSSVARAHGLQDARVLHPSLMFRLFGLFWSGHRGTGFMDAHTRFALQQAPAVVPRSELPREYVAVKFYAARSLPDVPDIRRRLRWIVDSLAERLPVVLLDTGLAIDDHADHELTPSSRVISARDLMTPRDNLAVQTQIAAGATAFVGTCGSITWLAPRLGVPTSAVLADAEFLNAHLTFAMRSYQRLAGAGRFCALDLRALDPLVLLPQWRILFLARHFTYYRNFEGAIRELASRGHQVHLAVDREDGRSIADRLAATSPQVTFGMTPEPRPSREGRLAEALRLGLDALRFQDPSYDEAPAIRARASERTPRAAAWLEARAGRARAARWLGALEAAIPVPAEVEAFVRAQAPDLLLLTPLIELGSPQVDYLRAAKRLGLPTALCVWSWDHLSSKALIRVRPDRVIVWNETQRREAIELHEVPAEQVIVTGAQCFDQWFSRQPARSREEFCRRAGLPDAAPYVLWVCSALFRGSLPEAPFVRRWIQALRASTDPALRDARILVRPHPQRTAEWERVDLPRELPGVAIFGSNPINPASRNDYFDSLFHSAAVVGLNTSALIEAAIVDRPVYTVLAPEFHDNQEGTFHFRYLLSAGNGFLHAARTLDEHAAQLAEGLRGRTSAGNRAFVEAFIRPGGLSRPATPAFVEAVEGLAALPAVQPAAANGHVAASIGARLAALALATPAGRRWLGDPRWEREAAAKAAILAERARRYDAEHSDRRWALRRRRWTKTVAAIKTAILRTGLVPRPRH